jgi:aspartyl aminopeptidase
VWQGAVQRGGRYFFARNGSTLVAFSVGKQWAVGAGWSIVGAHTDSPNLQLKPISNLQSQGFLQLGVSTYGGGLWHTWFDRDLSVAGRVFVANALGDIESRLVYIPRPIMRIPSLAIHLDRTVSDAFKFNSETHLVPVLESSVKAQLETSADAQHNSDLVKAIAEELKVESSSIRGFELSIVDTQDATLGGLREEFIFAPRIDNLVSSFCSVEALRESSSRIDDERVRVALLFDHEEVGSRSAVGAMSPILQETMERVSRALANEAGDLQLPAAKQKSFIVSADMAHSVHPNYQEKHEGKHRPKMHQGPAIKMNIDQRYATNAETLLVLEEIARQKKIPIQKFVVRNDVACGSTIGPILAGETGIRCVDIGAPQLSMHSIREMCGIDDLSHTTDLLIGFYDTFGEVDRRLHGKEDH